MTIQKSPDCFPSLLYKYTIHISKRKKKTQVSKEYDL